MAVGYKLPRGTRAALNTKAGAGTIVVGQPYLITDENRIAVGLTTTTYATYRLEQEGGLSVFCSGRPADTEVIGGGIAPFATSLTTGKSSGKSLVAATASTVFTIKNNGVNIGTATFAAAGTVPTFAYTAPAIAKGDFISVHAPGTADATLADISLLVA